MIKLTLEILKNLDITNVKRVNKLFIKTKIRIKIY